MERTTVPVERMVLFFPEWPPQDGPAGAYGDNHIEKAPHLVGGAVFQKMGSDATSYHQMQKESTSLTHSHSGDTPPIRAVSMVPAPRKRDSQEHG